MMRSLMTATAGQVKNRTELRKHGIILMDSSVVVSGEMEPFLANSGKDLQKLDKKLLILRTTQHCLRNNAESQPAARRGLELLARGYDEGIVDLMEDNMPEGTPERDAMVALLARIRCAAENRSCSILVI